jgi:GTPase SAR1 family protein
MINKGAEIISVIGGPQSGKTHYIVALIHELLDNGFEIGLRATPLQLGKDQSLHTTTKYEDAIKKLNDDLATLEKTKTSNISVPWIIRVDSRDPKVRGKQEPKKSIYLVFYDTAGEHFDTPQQMEENTRYLRESKAVIVVFDTLSIPKIKQILEDNNEDTTASDAATPFEKTWHALQNYINEGNEHLTDKPFAFVLSKFDVVLEHSDDLEFSPDAFVDDRNQYVDNSYLNGKRVFNVNQVEKADKVIRQVLEDRNIWDMAKYPTFVESTWGDNARFFGISAIGSMAKDGSIPEGGIKPYRVMDPLLWIMSKIGGFAFKTVNE